MSHVAWAIFGSTAVYLWSERRGPCQTLLMKLVGRRAVWSCFTTAALPQPSLLLFPHSSRTGSFSRRSHPPSRTSSATPRAERYRVKSEITGLTFPGIPCCGHECNANVPHALRRYEEIDKCGTCMKYCRSISSMYLVLRYKGNPGLVKHHRLKCRRVVLHTSFNRRSLSTLST